MTRAEAGEIRALGAPVCPLGQHWFDNDKTKGSRSAVAGRATSGC